MALAVPQCLVNMLRLLTFGGLEAEVDDGSAAPRLRRPQLAMLAVLAASGDRGVSRERVASLFWPESDEEHARHSARQVLYALRQDLGGDVVRSYGSVLRLDASTITSDVDDFRRALASGDRARAVELARGPFLEAFNLPGAAAFERWMEEERSRLASELTSTLMALATDATRASRTDEAVEWWRQLTQRDPLSGRFAVGYLKALAERGDRAEALAYARQHEQVLRRELETDPDPEVRRFEAVLRASPLEPIAVPRPNNGSGGSPAPVTASTSGAALPPPPNAEAVAPAPSPVLPLAAAPGTAAAATRARSPRWGRVAALAGLILLIAAALARQLGFTPVSPSRPTMAVGLIREEWSADSSDGGLVLMDMLATNLARVEGLRVMANSRVLELLRPQQERAAAYADAARRAGASELLEGDVRAEDGRLVLEARQVDLRTGVVLAAYRARAGNRYALVDSLTALVAARAALRSPTGSVADATTRSLIAYRFYEEGLRAYYQDDFVVAQRLMRAALAVDSLFAMAAWYDSRLTNGFRQMPDGRLGFEVRLAALRLAERAPTRERLTIMADLLAGNGHPGAIAVAESLTARYPGEPRALMTLSRALSYSGDWFRAIAAAERAFTLDSAAERDVADECRRCESLTHIAEIYVWADSLAASNRTAHRMESTRPGHAYPPWQLALNAARAGDSAAADRWFERHLALVGVNRAEKLRLDLMLERYEAVGEGARTLLASPALPDRGEGFWVSFMALRNQGRLQDALALNETGSLPGDPPPAVAHVPSVVHRALLAYELGDSRTAARLFAPGPLDARHPAGQQARDRSWAFTRMGMALGAAGDTAAVAAIADSLEAWGSRSLYGRDRLAHHYLRGLVHAAAGRHEDAVRAFRRAIHSPSLGFTRVNYELASSLLRLGRPREAVVALQPALRGAMDASNLYVSRTDLHELLARAFREAGQADSAAAHYRAVARAWSRADAPFRARHDSAVAWLARRASVRVAGR